MPTDSRITRASEEEARIRDIVEKVLTSDTLINNIVVKIRDEIIHEFKKEVQGYVEKINQLEMELAKCKSDAIRSNDESEQYSRRNSLRIFGIPESKKNENTDQLVINLCKEKLGLDIPLHSIDCSHRLFAKEGATKPIIVKFVSRNTKKLIYENKRKLKGTRVVIKEDLTRMRHQLLNECIKKFGRNVWTNEGKVLAKYNNKVIIIKSLTDLNQY
jgi:hypothetical protein